MSCTICGKQKNFGGSQRIKTERPRLAKFLSYGMNKPEKCSSCESEEASRTFSLTSSSGSVTSTARRESPETFRRGASGTKKIIQRRARSEIPFFRMKLSEKKVSMVDDNNNCNKAPKSHTPGDTMDEKTINGSDNSGYEYSKERVGRTRSRCNRETEKRSRDDDRQNICDFSRVQEKEALKIYSPPSAAPPPLPPNPPYSFPGRGRSKSRVEKKRTKKTDKETNNETEAEHKVVMRVRGRSKSRSRQSLNTNIGVATIWPDRQGVWLPGWYFGNMRRPEAEERLLDERNSEGSFLVRDSESTHQDYSLSIKDSGVVKHYRIRQNEARKFLITELVTFGTLQELVEHYTKDADGLCTALKQPCIQEENPCKVNAESTDQWEVDRSSLKFTKKLGQGQFGEVWEGLWNNNPVAIKTLKPGSMNPRDFLVEAKTMKALKHPKLIQLYAVCSQKEPFYIITELMALGSLLKFLKGKRNVLKIAQLLDMGMQVAAGMAYLEEQKYIHRDLATRNVLVAQQNQVKLADFGLARLAKEGNYRARQGQRFPIKWTAPEAVNFCKFSIKSDVWSFGILLTELVTYGRIPYPGLSNSEVLRLLGEGYRMPAPQDCPHKLYLIMLDCWHQDPLERPSFTKLKSCMEELLQGS